MRIVPIDFAANGEPRDPELYQAVQAFAQKEFGSSVDFRYFSRCWAVLLDTETVEVIGVTALRNQPDCQIFHIVPPTTDKAGLKLAEQARDLAIVRMNGYLADLGMRGGVVLVRVEQKAQRYWRRFLLKLGCKPADRFELTIH